MVYQASACVAGESKLNRKIKLIATAYLPPDAKQKPETPRLPGRFFMKETYISKVFNYYAIDSNALPNPRP